MNTGGEGEWEGGGWGLGGGGGGWGGRGQLSRAVKLAAPCPAANEIVPRSEKSIPLDSFGA